MKRRTRIFSREKRAADEKGAAAVEFALIFPLLMTFIFFVITYGFVLSVQQVVTQGAAEGARAAALAGVSASNTDRTTAATSAINRAMTGYGVVCGDAALTCSVTISTCEGEATGSTKRCATVRTTYNWRSKPKVPAVPFIPTPSTIQHVAVIEVN